MLNLQENLGLGEDKGTVRTQLPGKIGSEFMCRYVKLPDSFKFSPAWSLLEEIQP